jgi:beta-glucosidase
MTHHLKHFIILYLLFIIQYSILPVTLTAQIPDPIWKNSSRQIDERVNDLISRMTLEEKCSQMLYNSPAIARLGIPEYNWWSEALHGVARMGRATVFPQPIALAATFDTNLIFRIASSISDEARIKFNTALQINNITQYGGLTFWSPNINIFRDPRWGRGMETWGEDPYLTGTLGVQFVKGMQGNDAKYLKTAACAKHYVVHSGPEKKRHEFNAKPPVKDFRETYLPAFERLVKEGKVEAVMCAYNRTYDEPCCGSKYLLQEILRQEWNFQGHIVSDCWAITDFNQFHKVTKTVAESAAKALKAGVSLNCGVAYRELVSAIQQGLITEEDVNRELIPLLRTRFKLGLLDTAGSTPWDSLPPELLNCDRFRNIAKEAAAKLVVLLKNNGVLPVRKDLKRVIITGPLAADVDVLLGNYNGVPANAVTILEGITTAVDPGTRISYHHGFLITGEDRAHPKRVFFNVNNADATFVVLGINPLWEGEEGEAIATKLGADKADLNLPENQMEYLRELVKNRNKPVIAIVTGGGPIDLGEVFHLVDALLFVWYPGEQGGNGIADVIFGNTAPSGRLPITFPASVKQLPSFDDYSMIGRTYKYMEHVPLFPFGFGLSYTSFHYSNLNFKKQTLKPYEKQTILFRVTNNGTVTADEVVQLYLSHQNVPFRVPSMELIRYCRITLEPGESKEVSFNLLPEDLMVINMEGEKQWYPGYIHVFAGGALPTERSLELGAAQPATGSFILVPDSSERQ